MRILLVKPRWHLPAKRGLVRYAQKVKFSPLALGILAALSPEHEVVVADGGWEAIPVDDSFDLVGITTTTFASSDVYELARRFRHRGVPVVLGGVHPSIMPAECLEHADSVVVGEAEYLWPQVVRDAESGALEQVYRAPRPTKLRHVPFARRDLLNESSWFTCVEATRGCPNSCRYCYLPSVPWSAHRTRPVELVAEEIRNLPQNTFIFVDENLCADREYALGLFRAIAPHRKSWLIQVPTSIGEDEELLDALAEGGCFNVQVGFQSFNPRSLEAAGVDHNRVDRYKLFVRRMHQRNIVVSGFFLFGFDTDGPDVFRATAGMIEDIDIDDANLFILTPFPGTSLYAQYQSEGRLLEGRTRNQFGWADAVFVPRRMSPEELERGLQLVYDQLYPHFRRKLRRVLWGQLGRLLRNPRLALGIVRGNLRHTTLTS